MRPSIKTRFVVLDALRGLAAVAIALYHFSGGWGGYLAVDFFFVLSGFVLCHTLAHRQRSSSLRRYTLSRLIRLYPLHVSSLLLLIPISLLVGRGIPTYTDMPWFTLLQQLTLTHNIGLPPQALSWNRIGWAVSVIFWVNLLFFLLLRRKSSSPLFTIVSLAGFTLIFVQSGHLDVTAGNYFQVVNGGMVRGIASCCLGILGYRLFLRVHGDGSHWTTGKCNLLELLLCTGVLLVVFLRSGAHSRLDFLAPPLFGLAVAVFGMERGLVSSLLRPLAPLGTLSYSMFLNQIGLLMLVRWGVENSGGGKLVELGVYVLALPVYSWLNWRWIEVPCQRWGRQWLQR